MRLSIFCLITMLLLGCQQSADTARKKQDELIDSFKKVDSGLLKAGLGFQQDSVTFQITELSVETPQITDSSIIEIMKTGKQIEGFIRLAKTFLTGKKEEDKNFCTQYFIEQKKGTELFELMQQYRLQINKANLSPKVKMQADTIMENILGPFNSGTWVDTYFKETPNVAAITILNKFNLDITRIYLHVKSGK